MKIGTGEPEGLIASETANDGLTGGALVPLLSLGIAGDSTTAVLIGAFIPGRDLEKCFKDSLKGSAHEKVWYFK